MVVKAERDGNLEVWERDSEASWDFWHFVMPSSPLWWAGALVGPALISTPLSGEPNRRPAEYARIGCTHGSANLAGDPGRRIHRRAGRDRAGARGGAAFRSELMEVPPGTHKQTKPERPA